MPLKNFGVKTKVSDGVIQVFIIKVLSGNRNIFRRVARVMA